MSNEKITFPQDCFLDAKNGSDRTPIGWGELCTCYEIDDDFSVAGTH